MLLAVYYEAIKVFSCLVVYIPQLMVTDTLDDKRVWSDPW